MADLALNQSLIDEYIEYKFRENFNANTIRKLFKYIQPFAIRTTHSDFFSDPSTAGQFSDPLIEIIDDCSDDELVQNSRLKLMLIDKIIQPIPLFTTLNILNTYEKLQPKYGATYPNAKDKDKAQNHIKALLSDATKVIITDSYIDSSTEWSENIQTLKNILPMTNIELTIKSGSQFPRNGTMYTERVKLDSVKEQKLKAICTNWQVNPSQILNTNMIHDRYIETDKIKILLSSGLYHLSTTSNKDFTYVVEIK